MSVREYPVVDEEGTMLGLICDDWGEIPVCPAVGYTVSVGDVTVDVDLVWRDGTLVTEAPPEAPDA